MLTSGIIFGFPVSRVGQQFSQYRVISPLGSGGMGEVYLAEDDQLGRKAALKFLATELSTKSDHMERFLREARSASALNHPNICTIYEINSQGDSPFIAMEYIEGETVSAMIRRRRRNIRKTVEIATQVCEALAEAHAAGIVHRDIKPANIIVTGRGQAKILDFGLVKLVESEKVPFGSQQFLTQAGMIVGTASYMSPEQARGLDIDGRSDVWSLGVVLYEMLTGSLPFSGETSTDTIAAILTKTPAPPSQLNPELPAELERIVLKTLRANRDDRYESSDALLRDLREFTRRIEFEAELRRSAARSGDDNTYVFDNAPTEVVPRPTAADSRGSANRRTSNLRSYFAPIVGRRAEMADITHLLRDPTVRLITLTGIGGTGKTRLAHAVAEMMLPEFEDGVFMIELSSITLPELVIPTIAQPLGVKDEGVPPVLDALKDELKDKAMLLVLDNFEQVVDAAPQIADLLEAAPGLKVLVTSRFLLRVSREREFAVPPLSPPPGEQVSFETIRRNEAVQLFSERAKSADPGFELSEENGRNIAAICSRLEGLPLAIELAAARVRVLSLSAILEKLDSRLKFLTGGSRDLPERQRTMYGAIDWSHDLLDDNEKAVFRRLSVFAGSFSIEAAESVCGREGELDGVEVIDKVTSLLDRSLLVRMDGISGEHRFGMLDVVREYAEEALRNAGEFEESTRAHAEYFLALGEKVEPFLQAAQSAEWFDRLEDEHDNLRTAMRWLLANDPTTAVRLAVSVRNFWLLHSHLSEGYRWLRAALEGGGDPPAQLRFKLMNGLGLAARFRGDYETAHNAYTNGLAAAKEVGDKQGLAVSSRGLGLVAMQQGDHAGAREYFESGLAISRELEDKFGVAISLAFLGDLARTEKDFDRARPFFEEALPLFRELDNKSAVSDTLNNLGAACFGAGDFANSKKHFAEAANLAFELGNKMTISYSMDGFAALAIEKGDLHSAAKLSGAAEALRESIGYTIEPAEEAFRLAYFETLQARLPKDQLDVQIRLGRALSPEAAVDLAFGIIPGTGGGVRRRSNVFSRRTSNGLHQSMADEPSQNSIAVLPFAHMTSAPDDEYFCDGLADELISALAKIDELRVAARTSAFSFKGKNMDVSHIGRALNVTNVLEGSVRKAGDRLRITVQLVDASSGYQLWSERYDREMKDVFEVQDEITLAVVDALKVKLLGQPSQEEQLAELVEELRHYTVDVEAYQLYLQGRFFLNKFTAENFYKAIEYFNQAIAADEGYALAYAGLADAHIMLTEMGPLPPVEGMSKAKEFALKALSLDEDSAEACSALGMVQQHYEYDFTAAENSFLRAIELSPNNPIARQAYGVLLTELGRTGEADAQLKKALEVDPLSVVGNWIYSFCLFLTRRYDEAIVRATRTLELDPNFGVAYLSLAFAYQMNGDVTKSVEAYARCSEVMGFPKNAEFIRESFEDGWRAFLKSMTEPSDKRPITFSSYIVAVFAATLGDVENAFAELETSFARRESHIVMLKVDPRFEGLYSDSRFDDLLKRIGFLA
ncbi:MAG TPA: protein kinase [Pyrinomonadaceae bacterium]|nr:protein kinase [Pyrinomonadaceae bacterium]